MVVLSLEGAKEVLEAMARLLHLLGIAEGMEDEVIIFIDEHDGAFAGLRMAGAKKLYYADVLLLLLITLL